MSFLWPRSTTDSAPGSYPEDAGPNPAGATNQI
jgi:hypothetical protein